jgi:ectoine hydroxylase-related dioxygenase (phytanoyl-CoA dioxygenase family)
MFLAMPFAERQVYHQDGLHLTTQYQRDVHAVNVFVPVVDLSSELGPTQFCLGSHLLGNELFDEKFSETPIVKAGTPIIFDYRLGHRGLGNASDRSCRPIVYCTYARAADGKEFKDTVNFSRKRYHKIGELVGKHSTREERAKKREQLAPSNGSDRSYRSEKKPRTHCQ